MLTGSLQRVGDPEFLEAWGSLVAQGDPSVIGSGEVKKVAYDGRSHIGL